MREAAPEWHGDLERRKNQGSVTPALALKPQVTGLAEADGNRTHQRRIPPLTGFEDRGAHQERVRLPVLLTGGFGPIRRQNWTIPMSLAGLDAAQLPAGLAG